MTHYFITGLPRSRTAWLANFLTYGPSFCFHDFSRVVPPGEPWAARLNAPAEFVGDSDSGLLLRVERTLKEFPDARWVLVRRPRQEAEESFRRYFCPGNEYPGAPTTPEDLRQCFDLAGRLWHDAVYLLRRRGNTLFVDFDALGEEKTIRSVWDWCLPSVPFLVERWKMLETFQVNVIPSKLGV